MWSITSKVPELDCNNMGENYTYDPTSDYFTGLPYEMLIKIFANLEQVDLTRVAQVCQKFGDVAKYEPFWKKAVSITHTTVTSDELEIIIRFPIKELTFSSCELVVENKLIYAAEREESNFSLHLEKLSLIKMSIFQTQVCKYILRKCRPRHLILDNIQIWPCLLNAATANKSLEVFAMRSVTFHQFKDHCFDSSHVFQFCENLKELDMQDCSFTTEQVHWLAKRLPKSVEKLTWFHIYIEGDRHWYDLSFIETVVARLPDLKLLGIDLIYILMQASSERLAKLQFLNTLRLCNCERNAVFKYLYNIFNELPTVKTVEVKIKGELTAKFWEKLDFIKTDLRDGLGIHFDVICVGGYLSILKLR